MYHRSTRIDGRLEYTEPAFKHGVDGRQRPAVYDLVVVIIAALLRRSLVTFVK